MMLICLQVGINENISYVFETQDIVLVTDALCFRFKKRFDYVKKWVNSSQFLLPIICQGKNILPHASLLMQVVLFLPICQNFLE